MDGARWRRELEQRRGEIHAELKRGLRFHSGVGGEGDRENAGIDFLIDKFWDEFLAVIRGRREEERDADIEGKILKVLNRVLGEASTSGAPSFAPPEEVPEDLEELEAEPEEAAAFEAIDGGGEAGGLETGLDFVRGAEELPGPCEPSWALEDLAGEIELGLIREGAGEEEPRGLPGLSPEEGDSSDSAPGYPEELSGDYRGFHLYIPFSSEVSGPLELLEAAGGEAEPEDLREIDERERALSPGKDAPDTVIEERDGINYIRTSLLHSGMPMEDLDPEFQGLIDSIISRRISP
jgi:hypothetical protein